MLKGFKAFLLRGNILDLAIGIVVGGAFTGVVNGLLDGILNPLIAAIFGQPDISYVGHFTVNGADFSIGEFAQALLNFLIIATTLYFLVIVPVKRLSELGARKEQEPEPEPVPAPTDEYQVLCQIRDLLSAAPPAPDA
ncbi:MAG: large conductance mechanosensitive channel protein MscL [Promicromonosporaceae bacterium]|nr:large conductance mechanosensitive channel protein MscL [Promicromonosporaceae bacterium]